MNEYYILKNGKQIRADTLKKCMKKYIHSENGKQKHIEYIKKNKVKISEYNKKYMKRKREISIKNKCCSNCFKKLPVDTKLKTCIKCRIRNIKNKEKRNAR